MDESSKELRSYVERLQARQGRDAQGVPIALIDPVAVYGVITTPIETLLDNVPTGVARPIQWLEGFPTIEGVPIWEKLEGEPVEYYTWYKAYRKAREAGKVRSLYTLAVELGQPLTLLTMASNLYHWQIRCNAYDDFLARERQTLVERRQIEIEGRHATVGKRLFEMASEYILQHPEMMTPKVALQMLDSAVKLERIASGLSVEGKGVTINNTTSTHVDNTPTPGTQIGTQTGNVDSDKQRLAEMLNVMQHIGVFNKAEAVEVEVVAVDGN